MKLKILIFLAGILTSALFFYSASYFKQIYCDIECNAQNMYKNKEFYKMKENFEIKDGAISYKNNGFKVNFPTNNSIDFSLAFSEGIIAFSSINDIIMIAKPRIENNRPQWYCEFHSKQKIEHNNRLCSF